MTRVFCSNCGAALAHKSVAFGDAMAVRACFHGEHPSRNPPADTHAETGNLPDFAKIPFEAELFVKNRWTGIPEIKGANQAQAM